MSMYTFNIHSVPKKFIFSGQQKKALSFNFFKKIEWAYFTMLKYPYVDLYVVYLSNNF